MRFKVTEKDLIKLMMSSNANGLIYRVVSGILKQIKSARYYTDAETFEVTVSKWLYTHTDVKSKDFKYVEIVDDRFEFEHEFDEIGDRGAYIGGYFNIVWVDKHNQGGYEKIIIVPIK